MGSLHVVSHPALTYGAIVALAIAIVYLIMPVVILVAKKKRLLDTPDTRKIHIWGTPNLGGIPIFFVFAFISLLFDVGSYFPQWDYILAAAFLLFATGLKDDLINISPNKKFLAQFVAALIVVSLADIRIANFHGFLGIHEVPYIVSVLFSTVGIIFVTNAFNLIDGIDGLAGGLSFIYFAFFGLFFALNGIPGLAFISFALLGAVIGFLWYNISPAKIFMGDSGSLVLGFLTSILCISFVTKISAFQGTLPVSFSDSGLSVAFAVIIVPVLDTFRVFLTRILRGKSPFRPDRRHIHHILLDIGLSHRRVCSVLITSTAILVAFSIWLSSLSINPTYIILSLMCIGIAMVYVAKRILLHKTKSGSSLKPAADPALAPKPATNKDKSTFYIDKLQELVHNDMTNSH